MLSALKSRYDGEPRLFVRLDDQQYRPFLFLPRRSIVLVPFPSLHFLCTDGSPFSRSTYGSQPTPRTLLYFLCLDSPLFLLDYYYFYDSYSRNFFLNDGDDFCLRRHSKRESFSSRSDRVRCDRFRRS